MRSWRPFTANFWTRPVAERRPGFLIAIFNVPWLHDIYTTRTRHGSTSKACFGREVRSARTVATPIPNAFTNCVAASRSCRRWPAQLLEVSMVASVAGIIRGRRADPPLLALARSSQRDAAFRARINRVLLVARTLPSSAVGDVDRPAHADRGKKFMPRLGVVPEHTQHAARDHADAGLVDAAGGHALMRRLGDDGDAVRL
jgi:hypothetical protein